MRKVVAETGNYTISIDREISRLYIVLTGFWTDPSLTPDYVKDISSAVERLDSPFTALVDVRRMKTPGHLVKDIHIEAQRVTIAAGLIRTAEVFPEGISKELTLEDYSLVSNLVRRGFKSYEKAENWLNQLL